MKVLLPPEALQPVYSRSPFSGLFGWAFDYEGKRASVVVYDSPGQYIKTYLYTLSISPSGASLALDASDEVICSGYAKNGYATGAFKVPLVNGGVSEPVDLGPNYGTYTPAACLAPLHVWYDKSGQKNVVWYENRESINEGRPPDENRIDGRPVGTPSPPVRVWMSKEENLNIQFIEYPDVLGGSYWRQTNQRVYIQGYRPDDDYFTPTKYEYKASATQDYVTQLTLFGSTPFDDGVQMYSIKLVRLWQTTTYGVLKTFRSSVVIPTFEREGAVSCIESRTAFQGKDSGFSTYVSVGKSYSYSGDPPSNGWYNNLSDDGLPNAGTETCYFPQEKDSWRIPQYPSSDEQFPDGLLGAWVKGSFGGFGGAYGSSFLPASFAWRDDWPESGSNKVMSPFFPLSMSSYVSSKQSGACKKFLVCSDEVVNLSTDSGENYFDSDYARSPDYAFFHSEGYPVYLLIRSWNGKLRYSPSKLNETDFDNSKFGEYRPHASLREFSINFVGDA